LEPAFGIFTRIRQNPLKLLSQRPAFLVPPLSIFVPVTSFRKKAIRIRLARGQPRWSKKKKKTPTPLLFSRPSTSTHASQPEPPATISVHTLCYTRKVKRLFLESSERQSITFLTWLERNYVAMMGDGRQIALCLVSCEANAGFFPLIVSINDSPSARTRGQASGDRAVAHVRRQGQSAQERFPSLSRANHQPIDSTPNEGI